MWLFIIRLARAAMTCLNRPMKNKISPHENTPIILPHKEPWATPEDILNYTRKCLRACGLDGWKVAFDRSKEHLGLCNCHSPLVLWPRAVQLSKTNYLLRTRLCGYLFLSVSILHLAYHRSWDSARNYRCLLWWLRRAWFSVANGAWSVGGRWSGPHTYRLRLCPRTNSFDKSYAIWPSGNAPQLRAHSSTGCPMTPRQLAQVRWNWHRMRIVFGRNFYKT